MALLRLSCGLSSSDDYKMLIGQRHSDIQIWPLIGQEHQPI